MVEATTGATVRRRQVKGGSSAHSQDSLTVHFGLGDTPVVDRLRVRWPSSAESVFSHVPVDRYLEVVEDLLFADGWESGDASRWSSGASSLSVVSPSHPRETRPERKEVWIGGNVSGHKPATTLPVPRMPSNFAGLPAPYRDCLRGLRRLLSRTFSSENSPNSLPSLPALRGIVSEGKDPKADIGIWTLPSAR